MNPQEQRVADALIDRVRQKRDSIDPELAQRIHQGLRDAPDAFYLLAQAAVAQGVQLETMQAQAQQLPSVQQGWQQQPPPSPPQQPGFLESIFGPSNPAPAQNYYGQQPGYGAPGQSPPPQQAASAPAPGQPLGSAGYQAVNANLPGANASPTPQYQPSGYGQPAYPAQPQPYAQPAYGGGQYPNQPYPQQQYGALVVPSGYPSQPSYGQPSYGQTAYPPAGMPQGGYAPAGGVGFPPASGYPGGGGWAQPGGGMLGGMGGMVAGVAAGALVTGAVESVVHGYENNEMREQEMAREEHHDRGLTDTSGGREDSSFYNPSKDASRNDDPEASNFADTTDDDISDNDGDSDTNSSDDSDNSDASDFGGFSDDNS